ncbi:hypothetical protein BH10PLA2_BH10PLA2_13980 [soil metagenome]
MKKLVSFVVLAGLMSVVGCDAAKSSSTSKTTVEKTTTTTPEKK